MAAGDGCLVNRGLLIGTEDGRLRSFFYFILFYFIDSETVLKFSGARKPTARLWHLARRGAFLG